MKSTFASSQGWSWDEPPPCERMGLFAAIVDIFESFVGTSAVDASAQHFDFVRRQPGFHRCRRVHLVRAERVDGVVRKVRLEVFWKVKQCVSM